MFIKLSFYYRECDFAQGGIYGEVIMSLRPIKSDVNFYTATDFIQKRSYFGMKKEYGEQRESTSTNLVAILMNYKIICNLEYNYYQ